MSIIGKKPFVNYIIDACSKAQVSKIVSLMDNLGTPTLVSLYGSEDLLSDAHKGVNYVVLKMEQVSAKIIDGILVYLDNTHCGFFGIATNSTKIEEFEINPVDKTFIKIREYLTVEELRQVCGDKLADIEFAGEMVTEEEMSTAIESAVNDKPTVYEINKDLDQLASITGLLSSLKAGDIIVDSGFYSSIVSFVDSATIEITDVSHQQIYQYDYDDVEEKWELVDERDYGGTKLYKHQCSCGNYVSAYDFLFTFYSYKNYSFVKMNQGNKTDFESVKPLLSLAFVGLVSYGGSQYVGIITDIGTIQANVVDEWSGKLTVQDITNNQQRTVIINSDTITEL